MASVKVVESPIAGSQRTPVINVSACNDSQEEIYRTIKEKEEDDVVAKLLRPYSSFLVNYPSVIIFLTFIVVAFSAVLGVVKATGAKNLPDFKDPIKGYEARGSMLSLRAASLQNLRNFTTKQQNLHLRGSEKRNESSITTDSYFHLGDKANQFAIIYQHVNKANLFNHMDSLCQWHKQKVETLSSYNKFVKRVHHMPNYIAWLHNQNDCTSINSSHVDKFVSLLKTCVGYYKNGTFLNCTKTSSNCNGISNTCTFNNNRQYTASLLYNTFYYLGDLSLQDDPSFLRTTASFPILVTRVNVNKELFAPLYAATLKDLSDSIYNDIKVVAFDMWGSKFYFFRKEIIKQTVFVLIAIIFIILFTWFYSGSLFLALMPLGCIIITIIVSYFVYGRIYNMDFFPFLNIAVLIFIIGIGADDVYVYTGVWQEAKLIYKISKVNDHMEYLIKWTIHTLRHAIIAMMVTSLTTAAAFFANMTSDVPAIKCFGLFSGTCIIVNYLLMVTLFPACVIIHDKYLSKCMSCCCPCICQPIPVIAASQDSTGAVSVKNNIEIANEVNESYEDENINNKVELSQKENGGDNTNSNTNAESPQKENGGDTNNNNNVELPQKENSGDANINNNIELQNKMQDKTENTNINDNVELPKKEIDNIGDISVDVSTKGNDQTNIHQKMNYILNKISDALFITYLPKLVCQGKYMYIFIVLLTSIGIGGIIVTFVKPGLNPPATSEFQLFTSSSSIEQFDHTYKNKFAYGLLSGDSKQKIQFVFGVKAVDNGNFFDPDNKGTLELENKFDIVSNQIWLRNFCRNMRYSPFYFYSKECNDIETFFTNVTTPCGHITQSECCNQTLPLPKDVFLKCFITSLNYTQVSKNQPLHGNKIKTLIVSVTTNFLRSKQFQHNKDYVDMIEGWSKNQLKNTTDSFSGWWTGDFRFYDLQKALVDGTRLSLAIAIAVVFVVIFSTSMNIILTLYSIVTIAFVISVTVATLVLDGWYLNIIESTIFSVAAGLSADFTLHYSVAYKSSLNKENRKERVRFTIAHMGPPIIMGAVTTFLGGVVMLAANVLNYVQIGTFLMVVMFFSWIYSTFLFLPLCAVIGPTGHVGEIRCKRKRVSPRGDPKVLQVNMREK